MIYSLLSPFASTLIEKSFLGSNAVVSIGEIVDALKIALGTSVSEQSNPNFPWSHKHCPFDLSQIPALLQFVGHVNSKTKFMNYIISNCNLIASNQLFYQNNQILDDLCCKNRFQFWSHTDHYHYRVYFYQGTFYLEVIAYCTWTTIS